MGHLSGGLGVYGKLRERLDRFVIGAPPSKEIYEILKTLYTEEEAYVASRMPVKMSTLTKLAKSMGKSEEKLGKVLERMAEKGLVMDFERKGKPHYMLSPTLLGFFEFSFMRVREDIPQKELAPLMWEYVHQNRDVAKALISGETPLGRALVHEDSLGEEDRSQILTYEAAAGLIGEAKKIGIGLCYCRHLKEHSGDGCTFSMNVCTALNGAASFTVRRGFMREVSREEALELFVKTKEEGLVYVADNVKKRPTFVCHCCGCCCAMLGALKKFQMVNAVATSSFVAEIDPENCTGCGLCAKKCQVDMITITEVNGKKYGEVDQELCLGCSVCYHACTRDALKMKRKGERVITPGTAMEKYLMMAVEQGKLGNFLFDNFSSAPQAVLRTMVNAITGLTPVKEYLLKEDVKSRFLAAMAGK